MLSNSTLNINNSYINQNQNQNQKSHAKTNTSEFKGSAANLLSKPACVKKYHSQLFDTENFLNPLVSAAAPLIILMTMTLQNPTANNLLKLQNLLPKEMQVFENKARFLEYRFPIILASKHFINSTIDEMTTEYRIKNKIDTLQHLVADSNISTDGALDDRFFMILERASEEPQAHIDLLELGFICLHLGYKGKYKFHNYHHRKLENIKDNLFILIKKIRGTPSENLYTKSKQLKTKKIIVKNNFAKLILATITMTICIASTTFSYFHYKNSLNNMILKKNNAYRW